MAIALRALVIGCAVFVAACSRPAVRVLPEYDRLAGVESRDSAARAALTALGAQVQPGRSGTCVIIRGGGDGALREAGRLMDLTSLALIDATPVPGWPTRLDNGGRDLRHIVLSGTTLDAADIEAMGSLPALEDLRLIDTTLSDGAVAYIVEHASGLRRMTLAHEHVTDDGAIWLERLDGLRELRLVNTLVSGRRVTRLVIENPRLAVNLGDGDGEVKGAWVLR